MNGVRSSWLGADGVVSGERSSGDIAQDGDTYISITGLPLQTQPVDLPLPVNTVRALSDAEPQWLAEQAGISGAEEATGVNDAKKAHEIANNPVGSTPTPGTNVGEGPLGGSEGWACKYAAETHQESAGCGTTVFLGWESAEAESADFSISGLEHKFEKFVAKHVAAFVMSGVTLVAATLTIGGTLVCLGSTAATADPFEAFDCYKGAITGYTATVGAAGVTIHLFGGF